VVRVAEDSQPYITVSSETTGFPFRRLLRLAEITAEVFLPASARVRELSYNTSRLERLGADCTESTAPKVLLLLRV
jgi:hypothetical protein